MKLEVGMYVRTKDGFIDEVTIKYQGYCNNPNCQCKHVSCKCNYYDEDEIVKASHNPIDLIEVGDYVNGVEVENIDYEWVTMSDTKVPILKSIANGLIKSIVTKEQFESMSYKIEV